MSVPLVSVVIPTFNRGYCIERTIKSVIQQTFSDWEIIVVDNYSSDETDELLKNFIGNKIKLLKINNNGIVGKSRNLGISVAQGKYVAFLDSDDWWLPTKLENSLNELRKGARLVYHDMIINYESPNLLKRSRYIRSRHLGEKVFTDLLSNGNTFCNSSVVVERKLLLAVSNISECEKLVGSEDYDLWLRISQNTNKFRKINQVEGFYTWGNDNLTSYSRTLMNVKELIKRYDKYIKIDKKRPYPLWIRYNLAICNYKLGKDRVAIYYGLDILFSKGVGISLRLKSFYIFLISSIKLALNSPNRRN